MPIGHGTLGRNEVSAVTNIPAGWYDDGSGAMRWWDGQNWTNDVQPQPAESSQPGAAPGMGPAPGAAAAPAAQGAKYVVLQVILKEKLWGTGSGNLPELERALNAQAALGYRLHTITTASSGSKGLGGGDRIQATMVFERIA